MCTKIFLYYSRCKVPECDIGENNRVIQYDQPWLHDAIPTSNGKLKNCVRYAPINGNDTDNNHECSASMFNTSVEIECSEFIYVTDQKNVQTEVIIRLSNFMNHMILTNDLNGFYSSICTARRVISWP